MVISFSVYCAMRWENPVLFLLKKVKEEIMTIISRMGYGMTLRGPGWASCRFIFPQGKIAKVFC